MKYFFTLIIGFCLGMVLMHYLLSKENDYHIQLIDNQVKLRNKEYKLINIIFSLDSIGYYIDKNNL